MFKAIKLVKVTVAAAILAVGSYANASFITNADISSLVVNGPTEYTFNNFSALFNGITAPDSAGNQRFIGQKNKSDVISATNPITIEVAFNSLQTITSFSLFNDWGSQFQQQINSMTIQGFSGTASAFSFSRNDLSTNSFAPSSFFNNEAFTNIDRVLFTISGVDGYFIEIREFALGNAVAQAAAVSAPQMLGLFIIAGLIAIRRKAK